MQKNRLYIHKIEHTACQSMQIKDKLSPNKNLSDISERNYRIF